MGAAVHRATGFDTVADNPAMAVRAYRSELVNGALKAVESMVFAGEHDLERLVVVIAAGLTLGHVISFLFFVLLFLRCRNPTYLSGSLVSCAISRYFP